MAEEQEREQVKERKELEAVIKERNLLQQQINMLSQEKTSDKSLL
jgi:hypothetical protein